MNCREFETLIDRYVDGALAGRAADDASAHLKACTSCESMVTGAQQVSALLKTAVSDRITAVDVSGLWDGIECALESGRAPVADVPAPAADAWLDRAARRWRDFVQAGAETVRQWGPVPSFTTAAATVAAVALVFSSWSSEPQRVQVAGVDGKPKSRAVRIESLEVPSGYTVATWKRPKTKTQFISVHTDEGFSVSNVSHGR